MLELTGEAENAANLAAFRAGLAEHGYVEGGNLVLEYRSADGRPQRFSDLARELVRLGSDVIVTRGTPAVMAARQATRTTPIVMAGSAEPVLEGVKSLARPGANITGFSMSAPPALGRTRLQLLKEAVPGAARIGLIWNPSDLFAPLVVKETEQAARTLGVQLKSLELNRFAPFDQVFETALLDQIDALVAVEDYVTLTFRARILDFAAMSRLPAMYGLREFVDAGGLMSYGTDRRDLYRRSAGYVHRILGGANPAEMPIEAPSKFELAINLKTARALGLTLPPALLRRADHLIE